MVFLPAWNGRYYWEYPAYTVDERLGGETGFRQLIQEGHRMGFRFLPMFGLNAANILLSDYPQFANASTRQIDGNSFYLAWVDWDNDRHDEGWGRYMNVGVDSWRRWMHDSVANVIDRYSVDGYFLDIAGGWVNNTEADMHEGTRQLVESLRKNYPQVLAVGEFEYDALMAFLPVYQIFPSWAYPPAFAKFCRAFNHLSHPAPGRGSTGVHEAGFRHFDPKTFSLNPHQIPTITVVDDTFERYRHAMLEIIEQAKRRGSGA
jgi:glycosidase